jgi:pilus assembly protein Flp/PilA
MKIFSPIMAYYASRYDFPETRRPAYPDLIKDRRGATAIEYALIGSLISIAIIGSLSFFADGVTNLFNNISNTLQSNI